MTCGSGSTSSTSPPSVTVTANFAADTLYTLRLAPGSLHDARGRPLAGGEQVLRFAFRAVPPRLVWDVPQGIIERFGPQMVPVRGQGYDHADIRIHRIDPLDRDFWPFPNDGVATSDDAPPPLPGNMPAAWREAKPIDAAAMAARIGAMGSPAASDLLALPHAPGGAEAKFGLDLAPLLARIAGAQQAGTYLIGLRPLQAAKRQWLRAQVTDLSLTAIEEATRIRFAVTSLATAQPVAGAQIRIEGVADKEFRTIASGVTDADGGWTLAARDGVLAAPQRIVVVKGTDTLVLRHDARPGGLCARATGRSRAAPGSAGRSRRTASARARRSRARSATCSPSGRSTGRRKPWRSAASCAATCTAN